MTFNARAGKGGGAKPPACRTCRDCEWSVRSVPEAVRKERCRECAEAWAREVHECGSCVWNDPSSPVPSAAALAHCRACLAADGGHSAMSCTGCRWKDAPRAARARRCAACSLKFSANRKVSASTNELSNKGQSFESYDNHNAEMSDDRDVASEIRRDYVEARTSRSGDGFPHPADALSSGRGMSADEFARAAYDSMIRFVYDLADLTDLQALLFLSTVRGERQCDFAKSHMTSASATNAIFRQLMGRSEVFRRFLLMTRGTLEGTRGRKARRRRTDEEIAAEAKRRAEAAMVRGNGGKPPRSGLVQKRFFDP